MAGAGKAKKPGRVNKETDAEHGARGVRVQEGTGAREACLCTTEVFDRRGQVRKMGVGGAMHFLLLGAEGRRGSLKLVDTIFLSPGAFSCWF